MNLTEAQKWENIAKAFYKPPKQRNENEHYLTRGGICNAIEQIYPHSIFSPTPKKMLLMIAHVILDVYLFTNGYSTYFCARNRRNDILRADYCWLQKCICEKE